ncbi:polyprenyl synthetase family protein [Candidatus Gottesmanbacteria bacterium]|nr:polyprenyl synthetase family protein [Candidatus Gottesmanbacteria bacterium]
MNQLTKFQKQFNSILETFIFTKLKQVKGAPVVVRKGIEQLAKITLSGGKRIRPAFIYYGYKMCGGKSFAEIKNYLLAIEILQTFALIHDDIIDRATKRRGVETINSRLGNNMAILCGDLAYTWSDELFYQNCPTKNLSSLFEQMKQQVIMGQILDLYSPQKEKDVVQMMEWKTASYSVEKPLCIGAILAAASAEKINTLSFIGINIGLAFQTQDDIFGVFGREEKLGKSTLDDLRNGKKTLLYFKTLANLNPIKKQEFFSLWGNSKAGYNELRVIQKIVTNSGGLVKVINLYKNWKKEAISLLQSPNFDKKYVRELLDIISDILILEKHDLLK